MIQFPPETKGKLRELMADVPITYRKYLNDDLVIASAQLQAQRLGKSQVDEEALVRGFITAVPRHLRDGLTEILGQHNYDMLYFRPVFDEPVFQPNHRQPPSGGPHA